MDTSQTAIAKTIGALALLALLPAACTTEPGLEATAAMETALYESQQSASGEWLPGPGYPSWADSSVEELTTWDGKLIAAGHFETIGGVATPHVAAYSSTRGWQSLGQGLPATVEALTVHGSLLVAGGFFRAPGSFVAYFDGSSWRPVGSGLGYPVRALTSFNGVLYAGGEFESAGASVARHIARWNGSNWHEVGGGTSGTLGVSEGRDGAGFVYALAAFQNRLIVAGNFTHAGNVTAYNIAAWDPATATWSPLGSGLDSRVYDLAVHNGELYATGDFTHAGALRVNYVAKWNGSSWSALGSGLSGPAPAGRALTSWSTHGVLVGGLFDGADGVAVENIALWDGASFHSMGTALNTYVEALHTYGVPVAGGWFNTAPTGPTGIAAWWQASQ